MMQYVGIIRRGNVPSYRLFDGTTHLLLGDTFSTYCGKETSYRAPIEKAREAAAQGRVRKGQWVTHLIICKPCQRRYDS